MHRSNSGLYSNTSSARLSIVGEISIEGLGGLEIDDQSGRGWGFKAGYKYLEVW